MKTIVMTTDSTTVVNMSSAGLFKTGEARQVDDAIAESLLKRGFPKFQEVTEKIKKNTTEVIENG